MMYDISGFVIKMCKSFRYFLENVAPDYMTVQSRKYHEVMISFKSLALKSHFLGAHLNSMICYLWLLSYCLPNDV